MANGDNKEDENVEKDEPIVEVVSEKTTCYSEASSSGIRRKVLVQPSANVSVNAVIHTQSYAL